MRIFALFALMIFIAGITTGMTTEAELISPAMTCPVLVQEALDLTRNVCAATGRNQACYGHIELDAQPQAGVENFIFEKQGDIVNASGLQSLRVSALDAEHGLWGVALMRLQANLPNTLPGQNVTFLVFGDTEIINRVPPEPSGPELDISAREPLNVRAGPSTSNAVVTTIPVGTPFFATGRLVDGSWLRVRSPWGDVGWVYAPLLNVAGDPAILAEIDPNGLYAGYTPMQSFYLTSGVGGLSCGEMPANGVLIQTPHGPYRVKLEINGVAVELGSTVFFEAQPNGQLRISTLEGLARVEANGQVQYAVPGTHVSVAMDANLAPAAPPSAPEPYDYTVIQSLPVQTLDEAVEIYPAMPAERIPEVAERAARGADLCGEPPLAACVSQPPPHSNSEVVLQPVNPGQADSQPVSIQPVNPVPGQSNPGQDGNQQVIVPPANPPPAAGGNPPVIDRPANMPPVENLPSNPGNGHQENIGGDSGGGGNPGNGGENGNGHDNSGEGPGNNGRGNGRGNGNGG